jgi:hypothetical protein
MAKNPSAQNFKTFVFLVPKFSKARNFKETQSFHYKNPKIVKICVLSSLVTTSA